MTVKLLLVIAGMIALIPIESIDEEAVHWGVNRWEESANQVCDRSITIMYSDDALIKYQQLYPKDHKQVPSGMAFTALDPCLIFIRTESRDDASIQRTTLHEIGHCLGLSHLESDPHSIMYPVNNSVTMPNKSDIKHLQDNSAYCRPR